MSPQKPRKHLDDVLGHDFVYGGDEPKKDLAGDKNKAQKSQPKDTPTTGDSIMSKLMASETKERTIRLTVDMSESLHRKLSLLSARTSKTKAEIVRTVLEEVLKDVDE